MRVVRVSGLRVMNDIIEASIENYIILINKVEFSI